MKKGETFYSKIIPNLSRFATQDKMIEYLRQLNFHFVAVEVLMEVYPKLDLNIKDQKNSFMLRELKPGKWDNRMMVSVRLLGKKTHRVAIYLKGKFHSRLDKPWKEEQDINFKKLVIRLKFPDSMPDYEERKRWRLEDKKVQKNSAYKPSEFYQKWVDQVTRL